MPKDGFYFDSTVRQEPIDEERLNPEDNLEEFGPISEDDLQYFGAEAERLYRESGRGILASFGGTAFGDIALVPAPWLKHPKGIRDVAEWYISTVARRDYVYRVFERQCEIALQNLERIHQVVGDKVDAVFVTGTDFGTQQGPFISPKAYRDLFIPFHRAVNDWVHEHTTWKTFIHSCGSLQAVLPDLVEAGFDILNPVQCSAAGMDPKELKDRYGDRLTFWGGGIDTQHTLPFGTPQEIDRQVRERMEVFGPGGGFVFAAVHNIQAGVPTENLLALFRAIDRYR
jgi:uroporphyrinogen-III decarboxylase